MSSEGGASTSDLNGFRSRGRANFSCATCRADSRLSDATLAVVGRNPRRAICSHALKHNLVAPRLERQRARPILLKMQVNITTVLGCMHAGNFYHP
eukprot:4042921-Pyramimonas_sp.AAC.1